MQPPECFDRPSISQHSAKHSIATIFARSQSIAVLDARLPSRNRALPRPDVIIDADILSQYVAAPAIVVPGDHEHGGARIMQIGQRGEHAKARARNHRAPLEPELEEVAVHDE